MMAPGMVYAMGVGLLTCLAALALDRLFRPHRIPVRWLWLGAMLLGVLLPTVGFLLEPVGQLLLGLLPARDPGRAGGAVVLLETLTVSADGGSFAALLDSFLAGAWILGSVTLMTWWTRAHRQIRAAAESGDRRHIGSQAVVVTADAGPAVVGFLQGRIVLPRWLVDGDPRCLEMALAHEREHVIARDTAVLSASFLLCAAVPWNVPLWWMWRRLREAVEVDCDGRVLRERPWLLGTYAETLLHVGARANGLSITGAAALTESSSLLERRIDSMTAEPPKHPVIRGLVLGLVAFLVLLVACTMPEPGDRTEGPTGPQESSETAPVQSRFPPSDATSSRDDPRPDGTRDAPERSADPSIPEEAPELGDVGRAPTVTPYTIEPELENRDEVRDALSSEYPPLLRDAGIGGRVTVWFLIDADGRLRATRIREPSGHRALDLAALRVARVMEFTPARNEGTTVPVWISLPITFGTG